MSELSSININEYGELQRKINILWNLANICPQCNVNPMTMLGEAVYPPKYYCFVCNTHNNKFKINPVKKTSQIEDSSDDYQSLENLFPD